MDYNTSYELTILCNEFDQLETFNVQKVHSKPTQEKLKIGEM